MRLSKISFASIVATLALTGCGSQTFDVVQSSAQTDAPGGIVVPSKVDIVLAVDDSGSTAEIRSRLNGALYGFMSHLQSQKWDYRVTEIPLVRSGAVISQVAASQYDANWGAQWISPYPGAPQVSTIPNGLFKRPQDFSIPSWQPTSGVEKGLQNIGQALATAPLKMANGANLQSFIRPDALLVVIVFSNGEDTSDGLSPYYPYAPVSTVSPSLLNSIRNAKGASLSHTVRLYSVVSPTSRSNCLGSSAAAGNRYIQAANALYGKAYDICGGNFSSVLADLSGDLAGQRLEFTTRFLFLAQEPQPATIVVTKKFADGSTQVLPQSNGATSGWIYRGYKQNYPAVTDPVPMNYRTGYVIELVGDAMLHGQETATIDYLPAGVNGSGT